MKPVEQQPLPDMYRHSLFGEVTKRLAEAMGDSGELRIARLYENQETVLHPEELVAFPVLHAGVPLLVVAPADTAHDVKVDRYRSQQSRRTVLYVQSLLGHVVYERSVFVSPNKQATRHSTRMHTGQSVWVHGEARSTVMFRDTDVAGNFMPNLLALNPDDLQFYLQVEEGQKIPLANAIVLFMNCHGVDANGKNYHGAAVSLTTAYESR